MFLLFVAGSFFLMVGSCFQAFHHEASVGKSSVLIMDLSGVIFDSKKFVKTLKKYREMDKVKAIVLRINSPGGVVGPSQEIYNEVKKTISTFKKPVVVSAESLDASGAYYVSAGASKIIVEPGALIGSIGVIMEFANLKDLYSWAKVQRYSIKTGPYKDIGAEYRAMTDEERKLLQNVIDEVYMQFKKAIAEGRKIPISEVSKYADGRIFSGETAVKIGFADAVGGLQDAVDKAGELSGLGKNPETFEVPKDRPEFWSYLKGDADDDSSELKKSIKNILGLSLVGKLLSVYPGAVQAYLE